jgi:hypothetical protein
MRNRRQVFIVEVRKRSGVGNSVDVVRDLTNYVSKPGDARRSGRADPVPRAIPIVLNEHETAAAIEVRLGVMTVATITHDVTGDGYFWALRLPDVSHDRKPARDIDAARRAITRTVREWCEAAGVMSVKWER